MRKRVAKKKLKGILQRTRSSSIPEEAKIYQKLKKLPVKTHTPGPEVDCFVLTDKGSLNGIGLRLGYLLTYDAVPECQYPTVQAALQSKEYRPYHAVVAVRKVGGQTEHGADNLKPLYICHAG